MLRKFISRKRNIVVLAAVAALAVAGGAFAYFTSTGSGTGNATVGTASNWTVAQTSTSGTMYPGTSTSTINYTVTNPGTGNQELAGTTTAVAVATDGSGDIVTGATSTPVAGCLASWFSTNNTSPAAKDLAPNASTTGSVVVSMTDAAASQNACQGATPNITISAS
jgi:hypothetical protein